MDLLGDLLIAGFLIGLGLQGAVFLDALLGAFGEWWRSRR